MPKPRLKTIKGTAPDNGTLKFYVIGGQGPHIGANCFVVEYTPQNGAPVRVAFDIGSIGVNQHATAEAYRYVEDPATKAALVGPGITNVMPDPRLFWPIAATEATGLLHRPPPLQLDALLLSHRHVDHKGGLEAALSHPQIDVNGICVTATAATNADIRRTASNRGIDLDAKGTKLINFQLPDQKAKDFDNPSSFPEAVTITAQDGGASLEILPHLVTHSCSGTVSFGIKAPNGAAIYIMADSKIDPSAPFSARDASARVKAWMGDRIFSAMTVESTNSQAEGKPVVEADVEATLRRLKKEHPDRRFIYCFMSRNDNRLATILKLADKWGSQIYVSGQAIKDNLKVLEEAKMLEEIGLPPLSDRLRKSMHFSWTDKLQELYKKDPGQIIVLATGTQAEAVANLMRAAKGEIDPDESLKADGLAQKGKKKKTQTGKLKLDRKKDVVVNLSTTIPGNEAAVMEMYRILDNRNILTYRCIHSYKGKTASTLESQELKKDASGKPINIHNEPKLHSGGHHWAATARQVLQTFKDCGLIDPRQTQIIATHGNGPQRHGTDQNTQQVGFSFVRDVGNGSVFNIAPALKTFRGTMAKLVTRIATISVGGLGFTTNTYNGAPEQWNQVVTDIGGRPLNRTELITDPLSWGASSGNNHVIMYDVQTGKGIGMPLTPKMAAALRQARRAAA